MAPKRNPVLISSHRPFPTPRSLATIIYFLSMDLPTLDIPYKWNHMIWQLLCLASFTLYHIFKAHGTSQNSIPFYGHIIFRFMEIPHLFIDSSICWWTFELFPLCGYDEWFCYKHLCTICMWTFAFSHLEYIPSGISQYLARFLILSRPCPPGDVWSPWPVFSKIPVRPV